MRCEVCGRKIYSKSHKVIIEEAKLTVCEECVEHGKIVWEEEKKGKTTRNIQRQSKPTPPKNKGKKTPKLSSGDTLELVDDFDVKIKQAREKRNLSQADLGRKIKEKVSVLKKLETGKMPPDNQLARKLERTLEIKLLVPASKKKVPKKGISQPKSQERTLGDLIQWDKKVEEETKRG